MKYKTLGNSGLVVSALTFGTMTFGEGDFRGFKYKVDQNLAIAMVAKALDAGVNFFNTADAYCNGVSEKILAKALGTKRKDVLISTKTGFRMGEQAFNAGINYKHIIESAEASAKRLNTDYIDVYLLHLEDPVTPMDEILHALENLVTKGLVRYAGFSNFQAWKAATMFEKQLQKNYSTFVTSELLYSLLNRDIENEYIPFLEYSGIGLMVWSPLLGGFLSGKYTRENPNPKNARLSTFDLGLFNRETGYAVVDKAKEIGNVHNVTPSQVSIAWLLTKKIVSTVIIGASKLSHLDDNLASVNLELTKEELAALDEISKPKLIYPASYLSYPDPVLLAAKRA